MNYIEFLESVNALGDVMVEDSERWISYLRYLKKRNKLTYEDISGFVGVPVRTLQNWFAAVRKSPEYVLPLICFALDSCVE